MPVPVPLKSTQKQVDVSKRINAIDKGGESLDSQLIAKYDVSGPRYTSYPTAPHFSAAFTEQAYRQEAEQSLKNSIAPLSLYIHIPFCQNICYYCACNKIVTKDQSAARKYLDYLNKEIELQSSLVNQHRTVTQLHLGGGTPTFFDGAQLTELMHHLASHYLLTSSEQREYSIELDPRTVTTDSLALLKGLGFNRISLGVQDFDERVQKAVNRQQSYALVESLTHTARLYQFKSVSFDLIYGLPYQSMASLEKTLAKVIALSPDRIAFYNYAHLPERFTSQRSIDRHDLPSAAHKISMLTLIADTLLAADYVHIGMDHFVKADDDLATAQGRGTLQRNFQGYSTCMAPDLIGLGVSSISALQDSFSQNERVLENYYSRLDQAQLPIAKGVKLTRDDHLRGQVISQLICNLQLNIPEYEERFGISFSDYFSWELDQLEPMQKDGLVYWKNDKLYVSGRGRMMLRNICMLFDKYLQQSNDIKFSSSL